MQPQQWILRKRQGQALSAEETRALVSAIVDGQISDAQLAAFAMAVCFQGMRFSECAHFTEAMRDSGTRLHWNLPGPVLDKHSTGGVGDMVSLVLAPMLAACGAYVPMISGRGLGHTGGTQDKLEALPGYCTTPDLERFRRVVAECGCAIIGQTAELAPADRRLYAVRDQTGTVESLALITSSILSKKLAAGLNALVMDIKVGNGAFSPDPSRARALADSLVGVAGHAGLPCTALLTDMNQPLIAQAGNALEIAVALDYLATRQRPARLHQTVMALGEALLCLGGLADSPLHAQVLLLDALESGAAAERFARMCAALGGPRDVFAWAPQGLPRSPCVLPVYPDAALSAHAVLSAVDTQALGWAVVHLGGGWRNGCAPDPAVGLSDLSALGQPIAPDRPLALIHARDPASAEAAARSVRAAYRGDAHYTPTPHLIERRSAHDLTAQEHTP